MIDKAIMGGMKEKSRKEEKSEPIKSVKLKVKFDKSSDKKKDLSHRIKRMK